MNNTSQTNRPGLAAGFTAAASSKRLRETVASFPWPRHRQERPLETAKAEKMLFDSLDQSGWNPTRVTFNPWGGVSVGGQQAARLLGVNILALREGTVSLNPLTVEAHYDSRRDTQGADSNGSGMAVLLEMARILSGFTFEQSVLLALTDFAEMGFHGAAQLVRNPPNALRLTGAFILDSVGYFSPHLDSLKLPEGFELFYPELAKRLASRGNVADWLALIHRKNSFFLAEALVGEIAEITGNHFTLSLNDPTELPGSPGQKNLGKTLRKAMMADNVPFWEEGLPALLVTDPAYLHYLHHHLHSDAPDTVDYDRMAVLAAGLAATVVRLAGGKPLDPKAPVLSSVPNPVRT